MLQKVRMEWLNWPVPSQSQFCGKHWGRSCYLSSPGGSRALVSAPHRPYPSGSVPNGALVWMNLFQGFLGREKKRKRLSQKSSGSSERPCLHQSLNAFFWVVLTRFVKLLFNIVPISNWIIGHSTFLLLPAIFVIHWQIFCVKWDKIHRWQTSKQTK